MKVFPDPQGCRFAGNSKRIILFLLLLWGGAVVIGLGQLEKYSATEGKMDLGLTGWPVDSQLPLSDKKPTLVMFLHPKCPCSHATVGELEILLARKRDFFQLLVIFFQPEAEPEAWGDTALRHRVAALPGARIYHDVDGKESRLFHANISGEAFAFEPDGRMVFHGGITRGRGHSGDNAGRSALDDLHKEGNENDLRQTLVYGCPLFSPSEESCAKCASPATPL